MKRKAASALVAAVLFAPLGARADDLAAEADLHFQIGAERYQARDFRGALEHFLASNRLVPNRNVVFNVARSYEQLGQFADAYRFYAQALEGETDPATRERLEDAIRRIVPRVAILRVETDPPGATIYVDRRDLGSRGESPRPLAFGAGRYRVIVEKAGFEGAEQEVDAVVGREVRVSLALREILGTVRVEGAPAGAAVHVDAESAPVACTLPCELSHGPGRYLFYFTADGYQTSSQVVQISERQTTVVRARLTPLTGTLLVDADEPEAGIEVDGRTVGFTPSVVTVPVGTRRVRISLRGFRPVEEDVVIRANAQTRLRVALTPVEEVTAASRLTEDVQDAPTSVSIVPREELRAMAYPTVYDALRGVRGLYVWDDRSYPAVGVRGLGRLGDYGNRMLVLSDGMPINDNIVGSSYVGYDLRTDIEDVDRIEVIRGPGSVLYGTNAFSGVVNVVSRDRDITSGGDVGASVYEYGIGRARGGLRARLGEESGMWASLAGARAEGRDFYFPDFDDGTNDGYARGLDGMRTGTIESRLWWRFVSLQVGFHERRKDIPTAEYDTVFGSHEIFQQDAHGVAELRVEPRLGRSLQIFGRGFLKYYRFRGVFPYGIEDDVDLWSEEYNGQTAGGELRLVATPWTSLRVTAGGEAQAHVRASLFGEAQSLPEPYLDADQPNQFGAGYLLADATASEDFRLSAGARLDAYSIFGNSLNPRAALIIRPWEGGNLKVLGGRAFRVPSIYEAQYEDNCSTQLRPPEGSLDPETIYSTEIEVSQRVAKRWTALVAGFGTFTERLITLVPADPTSHPDCQEYYDYYGYYSAPYSYRNSDHEVVTIGAEAEVRREWRQGWMVSASYSLQRSRYVDGLSLEPVGRRVPSSPPHLASLRAAAPVVPQSVTAMTRISVDGPRFDRNDQAGDDPQGKTATAVVWDVVLSGRSTRWHLEWAVGVYNALDWRYAMPVSREFRMTTVPQPGRTFLMSAKIEY